MESQVVRESRRRRIGRLAMPAAGALALALACTCLTASVASAGCPNEALRAETHSTALPECRAYELVSPPYTAGYAVGAGAVAEGAEGVTRVLGHSFGAFAGAANDGTGGAEYEFTRTPQGWGATALEKPPSEYPIALIAETSADLASRLWTLAPSPEPTAAMFYREEAGGALAPVGPVLSPTASSKAQGGGAGGASADLSVDVFSLEANDGWPDLWPGDETELSKQNGRDSLYVYEAATGVQSREPTLVGVENTGPPPWREGASHINEGAWLLSECGTVLGGKESTENAISADGRMIFFTAQHSAECSARQPAVNELYARVGGQRTVGISEPRLGVPGRECTGQCESDERLRAGRREGVFLGASPDGSRVFFTSEQPLVNAALAGAGQRLYMAELSGGVVSGLTLVAGEVSFVGVSANGRLIAFTSAQALAGASPDRSLPEKEQTPAAGVENLYVYDAATGETSFIATAQVGAAQESANGLYLLFESTTQITEGDTSTAPQLFEYDAATQRLERASIGQEGFNEDGNIGGQLQFAPALSAPDYAAYRNRSADSQLQIADDGAAFFESADGLTKGALNRQDIGRNLESGSVIYAENVYEYREGSVYLISDGRDESLNEERSLVELVGVSPSGADVLFATADPLVTQASGTVPRLYDARVNGGFPAPAANANDLCGESPCRAASTPPPQPASSTAGSATTAAGNDLAPLAKAKAKKKAKQKKKRRGKKKKKRGKKRKAKRRTKSTSHSGAHGRRRR